MSLYKIIGLLAFLALQLWLIGCAKPKRFATISSAPANLPQSLAETGDDVSALLREGIEDMAQLSIGGASLNLFEKGLAKPPRNLFSANVSVSEAGATPASMYFNSGAQAQAEIVKLFGSYVKESKDPAKTLRDLFEIMQNSNARSNPNPNRFRAELTITHALRTAADWDRFSLFMLALVPVDPEIQVTDTNQLESVLKDLDMGTLTQTTSAEASLSAKRGLTDVFKVDPLTQTTATELGPSIKSSYAEQMQRKLREQLNLRSSSIERGGRLFRLIYRTNGVEQIPSMTRQVLTFEYRPGREQRKTLAMMEFAVDESGEVNTVSRAFAPQYLFEKAPTADESMTYELKAKPIAVGIVRRIKNLKGIRTLAYEDDDEVELAASLVELPLIRLAEVPVRQYAIRIGSGLDFLSVKGAPDEPAYPAVFPTEKAARECLAWFRGKAGAAGQGQVEGAYLAGKDGPTISSLRFGLLQAGSASAFRIIGKAEIETLGVSTYPVK